MALVQSTNFEISSCHKLTMQHLTCEKAQRQNVSRAAQIFSNTTATALKRYLPGDDKQEAEDVGLFVEIVATWFVILNSYSPSASVPTKKPYGGSQIKNQDNILDEMKNTFKTMRCQNKNSIQTFQRGVCISTSSLQSLYIDLSTKYEVKYILTQIESRLLGEFIFSGQAAPSVEACPRDSILSGNECVCDPDSCTKPPCLSDLEIVSKGTDEPGSCCPIYACVGCRNETLLEGKCPCAPGAIISDKGECVCVDQERHLVNGECVCNPQQCELPKICDRKSVLTTIEDGCCEKTRCVPCPHDSESTNLDTDELEDHCVCLPCVNDCGFNKKVVVKKNGTGYPGTCCDLYECKPFEEDKDKNCVVGDIIYENGEEWSTDDKQQCKCANGLSLCTTKSPIRDCLDETGSYKHNQTWLKDGGCTFCTCLNGELKCISHYCDVKESQIKENGSAPCVRDKNLFDHLQTWTEADGCTLCTCHNGEEKCDSSTCDEKEISKIGECQPLFKCNKQCPNGFRLNKKGCEICKCNPSKVSQELLTRYNISYSELVNILETYRKLKTSTTVESTTAPPSSTVGTEKSTELPTVIMIRRVGREESISSTEAPDCLPRNDNWIIVAAMSFICLIIGAILGFCSRTIKKQLNRDSYDFVHQSAKDNNNTIEKTTSLLDDI